MGILLLAKIEFMVDGLNFLLKLVVDEVQLMFLICDHTFLDFHLFDHFHVFVLKHDDSVFEGHIFVDNLSIFFTNQIEFLTGEFQLFDPAVHEFDSILLFPDH